jgi:hypothetical protein
MRRADRNRWGLVALFCLGAYALYGVLGYAVTTLDTGGGQRIVLAIFCLALFGVLLAAALGIRRVTRTGHWWFALLLLLPLAFVLVVNAAVFVGLGPSQFEGNSIGYFRSDRPNNLNAVADAQYVAGLYVETQDSGSMHDVQNKSVWVRVEDAKGAQLLDDRLDLRCGQVNASAQWPTMASLEVTLWEGGQAFDKGYNAEYIAALQASGAKKMLVLDYRYDATKGRFERVGVNVLRADVVRSLQ